MDEAAVERTGLDDFGPGDFRDRMQLLLDEVGSDENATAFNRATLHRRLARLVELAGL